jgi:prephenate dehydrogenase
MTQRTAADLPFQTIGIIGCGLIGCSIAAGLKARGFSGRIIGCGRPGANLETAVARGHVDASETDLAQAARSCDLLVVCTPVDRIVPSVVAAFASCRRGTLMTDAGSTKQTVCDAIAAQRQDSATFIGSHPIAGSEKQGCGSACPNLFAGHVCVITPEKTTPRHEVERLSSFWRALGLTVVEMSAADHDRALAQTSHVPHVVAAALAASLAPANRRFTAGGFQDTTRIAAGDPDLWAAILLANAPAVTAGIDDVAAQLMEFRRAIEAGDGQKIASLLRDAKAIRDAITS